ncbi:MAG: pilus assembly protein [Alphaproteobacteria bacterium]|nr:pilus assembly protein [Alphaproteobacteria bacterium]
MFRSIMKKMLTDRKAVTSIEFALIALPFFILLFGIIETSLVFVGQVVLDGAAQDSARKIRTGEAETSGDTEGTFKASLCENLFSVIPCGDLVYTVTTFDTFADVSITPLYDDDGNPVSNSFDSSISTGDIVAIRVGYKWDFMTPVVSLAFDKGYIEILSTAVFRNEPY